MADVGGGGGAGHGSRATAGRVTSRARKAGGVSQGLMLASMLDILMAILFFLLKNYSSVVSDFQMSKDLSLPTSSALVPPQQALNLVVSRNAVVLDGQEICQLQNGDIAPSDLFRDGVTITRLAQALNEQKDKALLVQQQNGEKEFTGTIIMQADKDLPFQVLKKVLYTAGVSDFINLKLAVLKKEEA